MQWNLDSPTAAGLSHSRVQLPLLMQWELESPTASLLQVLCREPEGARREDRSAPRILEGAPTEWPSKPQSDAPLYTIVAPL